jgi:hypothetical protein
MFEESDTISARKGNLGLSGRPRAEEKKIRRTGSQIVSTLLLSKTAVI